MNQANDESQANLRSMNCSAAAEKGPCGVCQREVRLEQFRAHGARLFIGKHVTSGKLCPGSYEDYTLPGEGMFDRWEPSNGLS